MKKLIAVLTVMGMVLTTLAIPVTGFANEDDYVEPIVSQVEFSADANKVVTASFLAEEESGISRVEIEAMPLECYGGYEFFEATEDSISIIETDEELNANEKKYEATFQMPEDWDGKVKILKLYVYDNAENMKALQGDWTVTLPSTTVENVAVKSLTLDNESVHLSDGTDGNEVATEGWIGCVFTFNDDIDSLLNEDSVKVWFKGPNGELIESDVNREENDGEAVKYTSTIYVDFGNNEGTYTLLKMTHGNSRIDISEVGAVTFEVSKYTSDKIAPTLTGIDFLDKNGNSINGKSVEEGSVVQIKITASDDSVLGNYAIAEIGITTTDADEEGNQYQYWSKGDVSFNNDNTAYVRTLLPDEDGEYDYNGEWYVEKITLHDIYHNKATYEVLNGKDLGEYFVLVGVDEAPQAKYNVLFTNQGYEEDAPTITADRYITLKDIEAAGITIPEIEKIDGVDIKGWYYQTGNTSGYIGENDVIELDPRTGYIDISPWYDKLVFNVEVGYLDEEGNSVWEDMQMLLPHGSTPDDLIAEIDVLYKDKHNEAAGFKEWCLGSSEWGDVPEKITPNWTYEEIFAIYENGEVVRNNGDDEGGSDWWGDWSDNEWFVLNSAGGLLTDEWEDNGQTFTESYQSLTWTYEPSKTLGESMDGVNNAKLIDVEKDGWELLGWKLYIGENFKFVQLPAGDEVTFGDPEHTISYVDTIHYEAGELGEDSEAGWYDDYIIILNQEEIVKADGSLYTTEELKNFSGDSVIYYAVAQWDEVKVLESDEAAEEVLEATNEAVINAAKGESIEGQKAPVVDEEVVNALKAAIEEAEETGDEVTVYTTAYAELVQKSKAETFFGKDNVDLVKEAVEAVNKDAVIAQYLDLTVLMTVLVNDIPVKEGEVTELTDEISFIIEIPEKLKDVPEGYERAFFVIRVHNGVAEKLPVKVNDNEQLVFKTGKFSTYALAYEDTLKDDQTGGNEGGPVDPEGPGGNDPDDSHNDQNKPGDEINDKQDNVVAEAATKTGDNFDVLPFVTIMTLALVGAATVLLRRRTVK